MNSKSKKKRRARGGSDAKLQVALRDVVKKTNALDRSVERKDEGEVQVVWLVEVISHPEGGKEP